MADMSLRIDEIEGRPIFVIESTPNCGSSAHLVKSGRKQRITGTPPHRRAQGEEHRAATPAESVSAYCNLLLMGSITKCAEEPKLHGRYRWLSDNRCSCASWPSERYRRSSQMRILAHARRSLPILVPCISRPKRGYREACVAN